MKSRETFFFFFEQKKCVKLFVLETNGVKLGLPFKQFHVKLSPMSSNFNPFKISTPIFNSNFSPP